MRGKPNVTKSEHILALWDTLPDTPQRTQQVAAIVGCHAAYVRVVARQRRGTQGAALERYQTANRECLNAYRRQHARHRRNTKEGLRRYRASAETYKKRRKAGIPARKHRRWDEIKQRYVERALRKHNYPDHGPHGMGKFLPATPAVKELAAAITESKTP